MKNSLGKIFLSLLFVYFFLFVTQSLYAQQTTSDCVITRIGNPDENPAPPPGCEESNTDTPNPSITPSGTPPNNRPPSKGEYTPPVPLTNINGIATEMAAYAGDFCYPPGEPLCHSEHAGLDVGAVAGTDVFNVKEGTVTFIHAHCGTPSISVSCRIEVTHDQGGLISSHTHVNLVSGISVGTKLAKGQQIATVYDWGNNSHLHFEFQSQSEKSSVGLGININPRNYILEYNSVPISGGYGGDVRSYTNARGLNWLDDGKDFAESYRDHPPCVNIPKESCWAH